MHIFDHEYPPTKMLWIPDAKGTSSDLIATSGEYLRIFEIGEDNKSCKLKCNLQNQSP